MCKSWEARMRVPGAFYSQMQTKKNVPLSFEHLYLAINLTLKTILKQPSLL